MGDDLVRTAGVQVFSLTWYQPHCVGCGPICTIASAVSARLRQAMIFIRRYSVFIWCFYSTLETAGSYVLYHTCGVVGNPLAFRDSCGSGRVREGGRVWYLSSIEERKLLSTFFRCEFRIYQVPEPVWIRIRSICIILPDPDRDPYLFKSNERWTRLFTEKNYCAAQNTELWHLDKTM